MLDDENRRQLFPYTEHRAQKHTHFHRAPKVNPLLHLVYQEYFTEFPGIRTEVRRKSKAYKKLHEGDLILSVNDHSCKNLTYDQVMEIADKGGTDLTLEVLRQESKKKICLTYK
ncbi:hypothetical protein AVEN_200724-1 [Araneus ventricosus]|uniref:PDZ domain-containing protein n=1 Tax=Araneus ventricosus TaxID=182803 RepID=A0A4Y2KL43_ARAVE|nr:hypothetical protein AVEN_200724-1 [Araneus ventricosus]